MRALVCLVACAAVGGLAPARAEVSASHQEWAAGPVSYILTAAEREEWKQVSTDADAASFERVFWARRDATPDTPQNEFQADFEARVAAADATFGSDKVRGAMTDRGRVLILLGKPTKATRQSGRGGSIGAPTPDVGEGEQPSLSAGAGAAEPARPAEELWTFDKDALGAGSKKLVVHFRTERSGEQVMVRDKKVLEALDAAAAATAKRPTLTLADLPAVAAPSAPTAPGAAPAPVEMAWQATNLTDQAVIGALTGDLSAFASSLAIDLDVAPFQAWNGNWEVEVQAMSKGKETAPYDLVGVVRDATGGTKLAFRHVQPWGESGGRSYVHQSLVLLPGTYDLRLGLVGADGKLGWAAAESVTVPDTQELWISELLLAQDIVPLKASQQMYDAWSWAGATVVPVGGGVFASGAPLWFYFHVCNAQVGADGKPAFRVVLQFDGAKKLRGPTDIVPVKAGEHCQVLAQAYDLVPETFPLGKYTLKVQVTDAVANKTLNTQAAFEIVAATP